MNTKNIHSAALIFFLLQLHTWHFSKAGTEIWSKSILKCHTISFPHIIEYIAVTRKHHNMRLLEIMMQLHNRREMPGRGVLQTPSSVQGGEASRFSRIPMLKLLTEHKRSR